MSRTKILSAAELRAEMARHRISRREMATAMGVSYDYVVRILLGQRDAMARRHEMGEYINRRKARCNKVLGCESGGLGEELKRAGRRG